MKQDSLSKWLKGVIIGMGLCGLIIYLCILPLITKDYMAGSPDFVYKYWIWMVFLWISAVPCYVVLILGWKIAINIGNDNSFSMKNSFLLKMISHMSLIDSCYFFIGNVVLYFCNMNYPEVFIASLFVEFAGAVAAIVAAALSYLVRKAAKLQEQSDLTI